MQKCDNKSVGVIVWNDCQEVALIKRANFPFGFAPPAGHVEDHGYSPAFAGAQEVSEEIGIKINQYDLKPTLILDRLVQNECSMPGGDHHRWWVYWTNKFEGEIIVEPDEVVSASWVNMQKLQELADRTRLYQNGNMTINEWRQNPGLEITWFDFFQELKFIE